MRPLSFSITHPPSVLNLIRVLVFVSRDEAELQHLDMLAVISGSRVLSQLRQLRQLRQLGPPRRAQNPRRVQMPAINIKRGTTSSFSALLSQLMDAF